MSTLRQRLPRGLRNVTGAPVVRADFYDRELERRKLWRRLETDHVLLLAPRRVGKTSMLKRMQAESRARGVCSVLVDSQGMADERAFVRRLFEAVAKEAVEGGDGAADAIRVRLFGGRLRAFIARFKSVELPGLAGELEAGGVPWEEIGEALSSALAALESPWVLMVDELPVLVTKLLRKEPEQARRFLDWFRAIRQSESPAPGSLRWLVAGSVGLDVIARRERLTHTINDFSLFRLGAFDAATADALLAELAFRRGFTLSEAVRQRITEAIGWCIPYHLQLVFQEISDARGERPVRPEDVDAAVDRLLGRGNRAYFDTWDQRLDEELLPASAARARILLRALAREPDGLERQSLGVAMAPAIPDPETRRGELSWLLDVLEADGYVAEDGGRFRYRSHLLREFFRRKEDE